MIQKYYEFFDKNLLRLQVIAQMFLHINVIFISIVFIIEFIVQLMYIFLFPFIHKKKYLV